MPTQWESLANEHILGIAPYEPGKPIEELEREFGIPDAIKLASNENPLPPSDRVQKAIVAALHHGNRYPDGSGFYLRQPEQSDVDDRHGQRGRAFHGAGPRADHRHVRRGVHRVRARPRLPGDAPVREARSEGRGPQNLLEGREPRRTARGLWRRRRG